MFKAFIILLFACFLVACSSSSAGTGSFTIISDQKDKISRYYTVAGDPIEEKECFFLWVYPPLLWFGKTYTEETLLSKVLEENNVDALLDVEFKSSFIFPLFFFRSCLTVSGTPVKLRSTP